MALDFKNLKGKAQKAGPERFKWAEGKNHFRMVSPVVPGYKYWLKTADGTSVPMDCLAFDREKESFTNKVRDVVRDTFPDKKCSWAYTSFVIDRADGKLKIMDHKKKLFNEILIAAQDLGDPTDWDTGWDVIVERKKTGPKVFNVEYTLRVMECSKHKVPLTEEERKYLTEVEEMPDIEEFLRVPTPEEQEKFIREKILGEENIEETPEEIEDL